MSCRVNSDFYVGVFPTRKECFEKVFWLKGSNTSAQGLNFSSATILEDVYTYVIFFDIAHFMASLLRSAEDFSFNFSLIRSLYVRIVFSLIES